jgi:hypothetical protein
MFFVFIISQCDWSQVKDFDAGKTFSPASKWVQLFLESWGSFLLELEKTATAQSHEGILMNEIVVLMTARGCETHNNLQWSLLNTSFSWSSTIHGVLQQLSTIPFLSLCLLCCMWRSHFSLLNADADVSSPHPSQKTMMNFQVCVFSIK